MHAPAPASTVTEDSAPALSAATPPPTPAQPHSPPAAPRSTGPKSSAGKSKSSQNALRHGAYAQSTLLPTESPLQLIPFRSAWLETLSPQTPPELYFAERIVSLAWRLQRFTQAAADLHFYRQHPLNVGVDHPHQTLTHTEDRLQSMLARALKQFHQLQKTRLENPPRPCPYLASKTPTDPGCDSSHHSPPPDSTSAPAEQKSQNELPPPSPAHHDASENAPAQNELPQTASALHEKVRNELPPLKILTPPPAQPAALAASLSPPPAHETPSA